MEFGLIALGLITLLYASVVMSIIYLTQDALDAVADRMSRQILTGNAAASAQDFKSAACAQLPGYMSCSRLYINVQTMQSYSDISSQAGSLSFGSNGSVSSTMNYAPGTAGSIVVLQMFYLLPIVASFNGFNPETSGAGSAREIISTIVIKTEPTS